MSRPPKPSNLKLVAGTARAGRMNGAEPEPDLVEDLAAPAHLEARSRAVWDELAPMLRELKVLTVADLVALEILCDALADYRYARKQRGDRFVGTSPKTGAQMLDQWLVASGMAAKRAEDFMSKFGMDPVSRARVMVSGQRDLFGGGDGDTPAAGPGRFFG